MLIHAARERLPAPRQRMRSESVYATIVACRAYGSKRIYARHAARVVTLLLSLRHDCRGAMRYATSQMFSLSPRYADA